VKSGGQNVPGLDPSQDVYEPEENWSFELGSKNTLLDDRLRFNIAAYYIDWTGIQGSVARNYPASGRVQGVNCFTACAVPAPGTPVPVIVGNLGDATVAGVEIEGAWLLTEALTLNYAFSYQDASYKSGQISQRAANAQNCDGVVCSLTVRDAFGRPIGGAEIGGNTLERQPPFQGALGFDYAFKLPVFETAEWALGGSVTYQDKQYVDELNLANVPARTLVDLALRVEVGRFNARLWSRNLFDEEYVSTSLFLIGTDGARSASYVPFAGEARTFGLTVGYRF
jgi:iron complex outermembrane receptor protein